MTLSIHNDSGVILTSIQPNALDSGSAVRVHEQDPASLGRVPNGGDADLQWNFESADLQAVNASATATGPNGTFTIGPVLCQ